MQFIFSLASRGRSVCTVRVLCLAWFLLLEMCTVCILEKVRTGAQVDKTEKVWVEKRDAMYAPTNDGDTWPTSCSIILFFGGIWCRNGLLKIIIHVFNGSDRTRILWAIWKIGMDRRKGLVFRKNKGKAREIRKKRTQSHYYWQIFTYSYEPFPSVISSYISSPLPPRMLYGDAREN